MISIGFETGDGSEIHSVNNFSFIVALVFVLSVVLPILFRLFRSGPREAKAVVQYAQKRGYVLVNPGVAQALDKSYLEMLKDPAMRGLNRASVDISDIEKLHDGTGDWLAFTCNLGSKEVTIFNLSVTSGGTNTQGGSIHYKVAKIKTAGLPRFSVGRNSALHTVETVVDKITGAAHPAITVDARQYPEFSAHFWIKGTDPGAVTAFLSGDRIRFLESAKLEGILATNANFLVYFEDGALATEPDFDSFIAKAEKIVANLLSNKLEPVSLST